MKKLWILFGIFLITLVVYQFTVITPPIDEKALEEAFYEPNFVMPDTTFHYELYADSLVLTFMKPPHNNFWRMDVWITDANTGNEIMEIGSFQHLRVKNKRLILKGFHLNEAELDHCNPSIYGFPEMSDGSCVSSVPLGQAGIHFRRTGKEKILRPIALGKSRFAQFHLEILNKLNFHERQYCIELFFRELKVNE